MRSVRGHLPRLVVAAAVPLAVVGVDRIESRPVSVSVPVSVDLSGVVSARSQGGFLHGVGAEAPPDRLIVPLRPALWRGTPATADVGRASGVGARYVFVLSDLWGYPGEGWRGGRPPWEDLRAWSRMVRTAVRAYRNRRLVWEVWNEPNHRYFW